MIDTTVHDAERLAQLQALPLWRKIEITQTRIIEFYQKMNGNVCVSFSGGKDSTVLAYLVRKLYPDVPLIFFDTGLEYPEIREFARSMNAVFIRGDKSFHDVVKNIGYPLIGKDVAGSIAEARKNGIESARGKKLAGAYVRKDGKPSKFDLSKWSPIYNLPLLISDKCCMEMKKKPSGKYQRKYKVKPFIGTLAEESFLRRNAWIKTGCNSFKPGHQKSTPMAFWKNQDVLHFIANEGIEIASVYGDIVDENGAGIQLDIFGNNDEVKLHCTGCQRTGCMFCAFGAHMGKDRFLRLQKTHPKQYDYCMRGGQWANNPLYDASKEIQQNGSLTTWNPGKIWMPSKDGLGMAKVFDMCNEAMGKEIFKY